MSQIINIPDIGPVKFERSKRARRVIIKISPLQGVRVAVPIGVTYKAALHFVISKRKWVIKHLQIIKEHEKEYQDFISKAKRVDIKAAREMLIRRLEELARLNGFKYNRVFIRNQRTRWGSCSAKNNINLNVKLVNLPQELRDYVILHELVHTKYKNHSADFWSELNKYVGDASALSRKITKYKLN